VSPIIQRSPNIFEGRWRPQCVICKESVKLEESRPMSSDRPFTKRVSFPNLIGKKTTKEQSSVKGV
jgi:hypothetical protein